jgi:hypothetical protein
VPVQGLPVPSRVVVVTGLVAGIVVDLVERVAQKVGAEIVATETK